MDINKFMKRANDQIPVGSDGLFSGADGSKRPRSNVGAGNSTDYFASLDPSMVQLRLLVQKAEFGRVIGKGGQMIAHIRTACGAVVKGINVDPERRIVVVTGSFRQVVDAFDMILELLYAEYAQHASLDPFRMQLLVENTKAGRVVGAKGQTITMLKSKSGVVHINMSKDPEELLPGQQLRVITVEGSLISIKRFHFLELEVLYPQAAAAALPSPSSALRVEAAPFALPASLPAGGGGLGGVSTSAAGSAPAGTVSSAPLGAVPTESLAARGVHADVVRQLVDIQTYLGQLGLQMYVVDKAAAAAVVPVASLTMGMAAQRLGGAAAADSAHSSERPRDPNKKYLEFTVPREAAGAIIGKGGSILRDMQQEVGAQIYIDRDDPSSSTRRVVVKADDEPTLTKAHERVMSIVNAQAGNANAPPTAGVTSKSGAPGAAPDGEDLDTEPLDPFGL